MRLLRTDCEELVLESFNDEKRLPKYAILSHTWLKDTEEVTFNDLGDAESAKKKLGWSKLKFASEQARCDDIKYVWIDTCCIDKASSTELAEAINSMFRWYKKAAVCYVYLHDLAPPPGGVAPKITGNEHILSMAGGISSSKPNSLSADVLATSPSLSKDQQESQQDHHAQVAGTSNGPDQFAVQPLLESQDVVEMLPLRSNLGEIASCSSAEVPSLSSYWQTFGECRWFSRGWTLQEMIAPSLVCFYSQDGTEIGRLQDPDMAKMVANITGIHERALMGSPISSFSIAQKMCWAAGRQTTRVEDRAYSLLGIFDISLPVLYGEGEHAFLRLQQELIRTYSDQTIFAWSPLSHLGADQQRVSRRTIEANVSEPNRDSHLLAVSPDSFKNCNRMIPIESEVPYQTHQVTNREVSFELPVHTMSQDREDTRNLEIRAVLQCCFEDDPTRSICLNLVRHPNIHGTYHIGGNGPRILVEDLYDIQAECTKEKFVVLLTLAKAEKHPRLLPSDTIICRVPHNPGYFSRQQIRLGRAEPEHLWNAKSGCFLLQDTLQTDPDFGASILIHNKDNGGIVACLRLHRRARDGSVEIAFSRPPQSTSRMVFAKLTSTAPLVVKDGDSNSPGIILAATVARKILLRESMTIVEVDTISNERFLFECSKFTMAVLCALVMLPAMVFVPILTLRHARANAYNQYAGDTGPALGRNERLGLVIGLVISILVGVLALLGGRGRSKWFELLPLRWRPTFWQLAMPLIIGLADLCLDISFFANLDYLENSNSTITDDLFSLAWELALMIRLISLVAQSLVLPFIMFHRVEKRYHRHFAIISAIFNTSTLVPLWIYRQRDAFFAPWTDIACEQKLLPPGPAAQYASLTKKYGGNYAELCKTFSTLAGLQWSILSLESYCLTLNAIALFQIFGTQIMQCLYWCYRFVMYPGGKKEKRP